MKFEFFQYKPFQFCVKIFEGEDTVRRGALNMAQQIFAGL